MVYIMKIGLKTGFSEDAIEWKPREIGIQTISQDMRGIPDHEIDAVAEAFKAQIRDVIAAMVEKVVDQ